MYAPTDQRSSLRDLVLVIYSICGFLYGNSVHEYGIRLVAARSFNFECNSWLY